jgi:hypothetical protein
MWIPSTGESNHTGSSSDEHLMQKRKRDGEQKGREGSDHNDDATPNLKL